jgi:LPXTG-motif cell wall-anchored protein
MMQAVKWTYYGNDATRTNAVATYGTKFAADNWMHKSMGIQLGLTDSARCQLPAEYDGTGYWSLTVYALGYTDTTIDFEATDANIVKVKAPVSDRSKLSAAIAAADALNEADYTAESWAAMKLEYDEAVDALAVAEYQADVDEATEHLTKAINALVKVDAGTASEGTDDTNGAGTSDAGTADTSVSDVKTGDADNMAVYSLAALLAMAAGATVVSRRRIKDVR